MNRKSAAILIMSILILGSGCQNRNKNLNYKSNPAPLKQNAYIMLPLGSVKPAGWLKSQLEAQASGLTGNLDDFWPDLKNSMWKGGTGDAWERGPYYLDGLIPLAYLLDNEKLKEKVKSWIEPILASSRDSGWYGPLKNTDRWPLAVSNKVLMQYYQATSDKRALDVLLKYFRYIHDTKPDWPDNEWRGVRAMENAVTGYWLYRETKEPWLPETIESIQKNSTDWTGYYEKFPWDSAAVADKKIVLKWREDGTAHGVNNAMAIKFPGLWYQQSGDERYKKAVFSGIAKYDKNHGQVGGRFSCDEHLSGSSPDRGTELCSVVEYMFSLEELYEIFGDNSLSDRLESLAFNSLPGTCTPDMWDHQYDQQANQVLVNVAKRGWISNDEYSNIYGLMPNFACCLANMHQGWPKFAANLWMATNDNGLAAVAYSPSVLSAKVANGNEVTITEETDYPFSGNISMKIKTAKAVRFPICLRVPGWADSALIGYKDKIITVKKGSEVRLKEKWNDGDEIQIAIPMNIRFEHRFNNSLAVLRGPLYFALRIDKEFKNIKINYDNFGYKGSSDWEISPKTPWNFGLVFDKSNPERGFDVRLNPAGRFPFADKGDIIYSSDSGKFVTNNSEAAIVINTRGIKIPEWTMYENSAAVPPFSPLKPEGYPEFIQLVPYGCARLRIAEFPYVEAEKIMDVIR
jgi:uncharacterized protein